MILCLLTPLSITVTIQLPLSHIAQQSNQYAGQERANKSRDSTRLRISHKHSNAKESKAKEDYGEQKKYEHKYSNYASDSFPAKHVQSPVSECVIIASSMERGIKQCERG